MKIYKFDKNMLERSKKYIEKALEDCQNSILFHEDNTKFKGADKEWHKVRMGQKIVEKETLEYIKFILDFNIQCYKETYEKIKKENNIIKQLKLYS